MRPELELIEKIEQYLNKRLGPQETAAFETQMAADARLREAVEEQRVLLLGMARIKARQQVARAAMQYHGRIRLMRIGIGAVAVSIVVVSVLYFAGLKFHGKATNAMAAAAYNGTTLPELNEAGMAEWAAADSMLPAQVFNIASNADTVVETAGGIVFSIPANAFVDAKGNAVTGAVTLCVKEALDAPTIITAGLSTTADGILLETGGMFFLDARQGDKILKINPALPVYAQLTGSTPKERMQVFSGRRMPGGGINWVNPQPLPNELVAMDIDALDFYPPGYMELLKKYGYATGERRLTDSIYYSLAAMFSDTSSFDTAYMHKNELGGIDSMSLIENGSCGINPAKVEAIHNRKFGNTLLATREFEQRMKLIHSTFNAAVLDVYVNHLNKNLYELDSMAARIESSRAKEFKQLAALHYGNVRNGLKQTDKLRDYYATQTKILTAAIIEAAGKVRREQDSLDAVAQREHTAYMHVNDNRIAQNFKEELALNLKSAYRQMGYRMPAANTTTLAGNMPATASSYNYPRIPAGAMNPGGGTLVAVTGTGWCNIDRYATVATQTRTTQVYTTAGTDKKAIITYNPVSVSIADAKSYDRLLVYLLPDKLNSYMKLTDSNGLYREKLNGLMSYELVCIGIKGKQQSMLSIANVVPKQYDGLILKPVSAAEVQQLLALVRPADPAALNREVAYALWDLQEGRRQQLQQQWQVLYHALEHLLFPCRMQKEPVARTETKPAPHHPADSATIILQPGYNFY